MSETKKAALKHVVTDVTEPNKSPPSDTSRPVIVTNRAILKDPMMGGKPTVTSEIEPTDISPPRLPGKPKIEPGLKTDSIVSELTPADVNNVPENVAAESDEVPETETATDSLPQSTDSTATDTLPKSTDSKDSGAINPEAEAAAALDKQIEHEAAVQKLIDDKQYILPVNALEKRRSKRFVALGILISLLLGLAWVDVALDASLIQVPGLKPVTHFFSN